jgi:uncharacterized protein YodC (DUF2158 family)
MNRRLQLTRSSVGWLTASVFLVLPTVPAGAQLTVTEAVTPTFGFVMGGPANRNFVLNTNDTVTGGNAADYMFGAASGQVVFMKRRGPDWINVTVDNISTSGGLIANSILCQWHNGAQQPCESFGLTELVRGRRVLRLGVDVTTSQFHFGGDTASITFDVTATFL